MDKMIVGQKSSKPGKVLKLFPSALEISTVLLVYVFPLTLAGFSFHPVVSNFDQEHPIRTTAEAARNERLLAENPEGYGNLIDSIVPAVPVAEYHSSFTPSKNSNSMGHLFEENLMKQFQSSSGQDADEAVRYDESFLRRDQHKGKRRPEAFTQDGNGRKRPVKRHNSISSIIAHSSQESRGHSWTQLNFPEIQSSSHKGLSGNFHENVYRNGDHKDLTGIPNLRSSNTAGHNKVVNNKYNKLNSHPSSFLGPFGSLGKKMRVSVSICNSQLPKMVRNLICQSTKH